MVDTLQKLKHDLLVAGFPNCEAFAERVSNISNNWEMIKESALKDQSRIKMLKAEVQKLKRQLAKQKKMNFGSKADRKPEMAPTLEDEQKVEELILQPIPEAEDHFKEDTAAKLTRTHKTIKPRTSKGRGKKNYGGGLERRIEYKRTDDKLCPCGCGGTIFGYDKNEVLECIPAQYYIRVIKYAQYRCRHADQLVGTPFMQKLIEQTGMSASFVAEIINMRYGWHLPWHRQSDRVMKGAGVNVHRSTLMRWSNRVATQVLRPIYDILCDEIVLNSTRIFMDETTIPKQAPGTGKTKTSYFYAVHRDDSSFAGNLPPAVAYYPRDSRAMYEIQNILRGCTAIVQHDGYGGYNCFGRVGTPFEKIISAECWAHARRHFTDEWEFNKTRNAAVIINLIEELYDVEKSARGKPAPIRVGLRKERSISILQRILDALHTMKPQHLGKGGMGLAIRYVLRRWESLTRFVGNGFIDLDTNPVERMFKPTILSRKNVMFIGSDEGGEAWAIHSSLVETCRLNRIDFHKYLSWIFEEITNNKPRAQYSDLLPWNAPNHCRLDLPTGTPKK